MSPQLNHFSLPLQLMGFLFLMFVSACQAATTTVLPTAINQHVTTQPSTTTAIVTQAPSEISITPSATTQFISRVEVQIAAQVGGEVTDIEINGTYAYLVVGTRLVVMDLSNPDIGSVARRGSSVCGNIIRFLSF